MKTFMLPDLGEGLAESEIVEWHVKVGDIVEVDQIVLTVETAKATVDVPAPYSGKIVNRHGEEGDVINIGSLLLEIDDATAASATVKQKASQAATHATAKKADAATVVGSVASHAHAVNVDEFWVGNERESAAVHQLTAMPSARLLAQKLGVDLNAIKGTGPSGVIIDADVYNACDKQLPGTEVLKGARRTMVGAMAESHKQIAAVTITEDATLEQWKPGEDITARLVLAIVDACQQEPALNAWFDAETMTRCVHQTVNIGVAVDSKHGLYVPVLRNADEYKANAIRQWVDETVKGIRERKIGRDQLQHATITLSNFGAIAGIYATPVVTPPQVAIVGAGRIIERVALKNGKPVMVKVLPLSMTFDHRACTGGEAARFMRALAKHLEQPYA
ncbi:2-oxo acid dehydrogenase subunit E2 [Photobacterium ganghwense]|uniref:Dihydrolipoamide acetyltransferase component of pyruvate dehydrogenase complex n=1 Tax=Photobacterium ganghwense TaxID=320778 RepID=A0A0J1H849_9GAMM|nr:dihydrolipoamide acetyltransferase family protein [Photobacterium ganghwense]KLV07890.1 branched-chain alpha-keto acid dehydrogenase subunit E2 [Photobacterium ganghwense]PSU06988.1 2-oxo acid dehydrogenase subunit E2 [Photobacterium ganghwense]QSV15742.1 2-oxo acid dehydrogenase subunit E2 [Photobacterium ganghwense]